MVSVRNVMAILCLAGLLVRAVVPTVVTAFDYSWMSARQHPIFPVPDELQQQALRTDVAAVMKLSEAELIRLLPTRSGIYFVKCPVPGCGNPQGSAFTWSLAHPEQLICRHCGTIFPHADYPAQREVMVTPPSGKTLTYRYHYDGTYEYYFSAGIEFRKGIYFAEMAYKLSQLYRLSGDEHYARRAAVILLTIAARFPDFAFKYDMPGQPVRWYEGSPAPDRLLGDYRTSRYNWWAYMDIKAEFFTCYDSIYGSAGLVDYARELRVDAVQLIEQDFLRVMVENVMANRDGYHNMSPSMWRSLIVAGRVLGVPDYVHIAVERINTFFRRQFFFDGQWRECSASYHRQSANWLPATLTLLQGYCAPEGYTPPFGITPITPQSGGVDREAARLSIELSSRMVYPNHRSLPLADSWANQVIVGSAEDSRQPSFLLGGAGYAMLSSGDETQYHLAFTWKNGHRHDDTLSMTLYGEGREMLSDIGYTHTGYHAWTVSSVAHNLVIPDFRNQEFASDRRRSRGDLQFLRTCTPVQVIDVDGTSAYPMLATYRRCAMLVPRPDGSGQAVVDFFRVGAGAAQYDYYLHGDADREDQLTFSPAGTFSATEVVPARLISDFSVPRIEMEDRQKLPRPGYMYGYLRENETSGLPADAMQRITFGNTSPLDVYIPAGFSGLQLFRGRNPAIRGGQESNIHCAELFRRYIMLRSRQPLTFIAVMLPGGGEIASVSRLDDECVRMVWPDGTIDLLFWRQPKALVSDGQTLQGDYGFVRLAPDRSAILRQGPQVARSLPVRAIKGDAILQCTGAMPELQPGDYVVVRNPDSGMTWGYRVLAVNADEVTVAGHLGFTLENGEMRFTDASQLVLPGGAEMVLHIENQP